MNKSLNFAVIGVGLLATVLALYMIAATNLAAAQGGNMSSAGGNMSSAGGNIEQRRRQHEQRRRAT